MEEAAHSFFPDIASAFEQEASPADEDYIFPTGIIQPGDPITSGETMTMGKKKDIGGLIERDTFKVFLREDVASDASYLLGRFFSAMK